MALEDESMTKLRSVAQGLGVISNWSDDKTMLLQKIRLHSKKHVEPAPQPIQINIPPQTMGQALTQANITEALAGFKPLGLRIDFPDEFTWELSCNGKRDSGTMHMGMWNVIQCAREVVRP